MLRHRPVRAFRRALACTLLLLGAAACATSIDVEGAVHVLTLDGTIDPVTERYVDRGIDEAEDTDARAVVIQLDTPGGLVDSMEGIVKRINRSEVPVIVYVWPSGGHAASAGTVITYAGHIAAMAPGTRIGAASVVGAGGEDLDDTLSRKATNDLVALITGLAEERGRNADWAEDAVRFAIAANASEAVKLHVVDFQARTLEEVLDLSDGRTVRVGEGRREVTLSLREAPVVENDMTLVERFFALLSDPNIAFLLLSLGATGILIELIHPGFFFPGVFGAIALLLAFFSLGTLPVNWAGVALIILAFTMFAGEFFAPGFGALGVGGLISLILGGLLLTSTSNSEFQVDRWLIYTVSALIGAFLLMVISTVIRTRRAPAYMGAQTMIGKQAVVRAPLDPEGIVFLDGARWRARVEGEGAVGEGERVVVTEIEGLKLTVRRQSEQQPEEGA